MTGHWNYCDEDGCGPAFWPTGESQSPIDLNATHTKRVDTCDHIKFINYDRPFHGDIVNNGHSIQVIPENRSELPEIFGGGLDQVYRLVQYHIHWGSHETEGSEHTIEGHSYPAELHLVHQGVEDSSKLAVLGIFLTLDSDATALWREQRQLHYLRKPKTVKRIHNIFLGTKLPRNTESFFRYQGSLTTPPCTECVTWTVFEEPVGITAEQLALLRGIRDLDNMPIARNFRPTQDINDRTILHVVAH